MSEWLKRVAVLCAAITVIATTVSATADPVVVFKTTGAFDTSGMNAPAPTPSGNGTGEVRLTVGTTTLVYHGIEVSLEAIDLGQWDAFMFGYFTVESTDPNITPGVPDYQSFAGASFKLTVTQSVPSVPLNSNGIESDRMLSGSLAFNEGVPGKTLGSLYIHFDDPRTFAVPPTGEPPVVMYTIEEDVVIGRRSPGAGPSDEFGIGGMVSVPLPSAASVGLTLLAGFGLLSRFRRRAASVA